MALFYVSIEVVPGTGMDNEVKRGWMTDMICHGQSPGGYERICDYPEVTSSYSDGHSHR